MSKSKFCFCLCLAQLFLCSLYGHVENIKNEKALNCSHYPWLKNGLSNSNRIKLKFGSYGLKVLAQDLNLGMRLYNLYSQNQKEKITRILALTRYETKFDDNLQLAHSEILEGASINSTLNKYGFTIKKDIFFKGFVEDLPDVVKQLMHTQESLYAAIMYNITAIHEDGNYPYCTILEVFSPEFLRLEDIHLIYPNVEKHLNPEDSLNAIDMIDHMELLVVSTRK